MGDHRAEIKIEFSIYTKKFKQEFSINWSPMSDDMDERIGEWFRECRAEALEEWEAIIYKEKRAREAERDRIAREKLYLELKKEFES